MKTLMVKTLGSLRPCDEIGESIMQKIKDRDVVTVEIKQPRNVRHHRLYFALVNIVFDNQEYYKTAELMDSAIRISAGHSDLIMLPGGQEAYIPKSLKFSSMDQTEFNEFYERVADSVCKHFLPGVSSATLRREVEEMTGIRQ